MDSLAKRVTNSALSEMLRREPDEEELGTVLGKLSKELRMADKDRPSLATIKAAFEHFEGTCPEGYGSARPSTV